MNSTFLLSWFLNFTFLFGSADSIVTNADRQTYLLPIVGFVQLVHIVFSILRLIAYCTNRKARFLTHNAHRELAQKNLVSLLAKDLNDAGQKRL